MKTLSKMLLPILVSICFFLSGCGQCSDGRTYESPLINYDLPETENNGIIEAQAELDGDELLFTIKNVGEKTLRFGILYIVQTYEGDAWRDVQPLPNTSFEDIGFSLGSGQSHEQNVYLTESYGELPSGRYRISKQMDLKDEDGRYSTFVWARAEFDIP